ncbi:Spermidine export protein mdtI [Klebsiella grimontii]|uniref:Spermidine export protein mdtI n=1 Tax=Klebsiella grimontii TaxID=2058152 RepID=A0A7H4P2Z3_9ENTR|nr:Spermidine export protein mdtI [Klebsiella grimontii]
MQQFEWVHAAWLALAIALEIMANVFLKFSDGFRRKFYGLMSLAAVLGRLQRAFSGGQRD